MSSQIYEKQNPTVRRRGGRKRALGSQLRQLSPTIGRSFAPSIARRILRQDEKDHGRL